ncbi:MAG: DUF2520 domain-containing protein [Proteobacteria bacterium]|nr:DUF2520 domain-containing protein [Pseudomonadota bacterium]MBU1386276.1 DUF2520 domain-containing protein [Pseudomonadota bacterium]MBU1542968.1 DUF2520 domain-containing protein [Pseudomonadota bacterium]MBU2431492.1 DUF2520 domain-containing protein [Pseudomonadota bacterium]MBU2479991.1 DUF2520 domain-containing protein [Pseudomonadota bacterium]
MNINNKNMVFGIIGCGRLGICLAVFLSRQGFEAKAFSSKHLESAKTACEFVGTGRVYEDPVDVAKSCPIVFITTPDTVIESVCERIASKNGFQKDAMVFHLSGALSSSILVSAKSNMAHVGSIHPLQSFAPYETGQESPFKGINISIEGDAAAVELGKEIVNALKANFFTIPTDAKTVYHAAAVVASNYLVTVEHFALQLLKAADISEENAYEILEPLIMGTLGNIKARGSIDALTGPVARGDDEIVSRHLVDIDKKLPQFSSLYRLLGSHTLDIAKQQGQITPDAVKKLSTLFTS